MVDLQVFGSGECVHGTAWLTCHNGGQHWSDTMATGIDDWAPVFLHQSAAATQKVLTELTSHQLSAALQTVRAVLTTTWYEADGHNRPAIAHQPHCKRLPTCKAASWIWAVSS